MADLATASQERALALRAEALEICDRFAWTPQCIGTGECEVGPREIYEELRCLQKVAAVHVSQALIDCCLRHQQWLPLFEDVEARIWLFLGERERAEQRWRELLNHSELILRQMAQKALDDLGKNVKSGLTLVTEVAQAFDRGQNEQICEMLTRSLLDDVSTKYLDDALEFMALRRSLADNCPWDRGLLTQEFILDLFEDQIIKWEKNLDV